MSLAL
ncbi:hypothetical protein BMF94_6329 [Rhodotorula taiwanensis]